MPAIQSETDPTESAALTECKAVTQSIETKADKNKKRARRSTLGMIGSSAFVPVVLASVPDGLLQKATASTLAAAVVVLGAWVQIEKPHERWVLYRRFHRTFEAEQLKFRFKNPPYNDASTAEQVLALRVAELQLDLHLQWEGIIPTSSEAKGIASGAKP
jgi:hypothetical protein